MEEKPRVVVGIIVFNPEGKILFLHSNNWGGKYTVPGGHVELGERLIDAVRREAKEEAGLDVERVKFIKVSEIPDSREYCIKGAHFVCLFFSCKSDGKEVVLNEESDSYAWASLEDALNMELAEHTLDIVEYLVRNKSGLNLISTK